MHLSAVQYNVVQCSVEHCGVVHCDVEHCGVVQHGGGLCYYSKCNIVDITQVTARSPAGEKNGLMVVRQLEGGHVSSAILHVICES